jgi:Primase C terminal 2 (PriCT-2)
MEPLLEERGGNCAERLTMINTGNDDVDATAAKTDLDNEALHSLTTSASRFDGDAPVADRFVPKGAAIRIPDAQRDRKEIPDDLDVLADYLKFVLPPEGNGWYCAAELTPKRDGSKRHLFRNTFHATIEELAIKLREIDGRGGDAYYAIATYGDAAAEENKTSGGFKGRKACHVQAIRDLPLDLDCGEDKVRKGIGYATQETAIQAFEALAQAIHVPYPPSFVVNSGYGVHIHHVLDRPLSRNESLKLARGYKRACRDAGLLIDPVVTADAARVLRAPGLHNYKRGGTVETGLFPLGAKTPLSVSAFERLKDFAPGKQTASTGAGYDTACFNPEMQEYYNQAVMAVPLSDERDVWLRMGMALHSIGPSWMEWAFDLWTEWSKQSDKYDEEDQIATWAGFNEDRDVKITMGTVIQWAKETHPGGPGADCRS